MIHSSELITLEKSLEYREQDRTSTSISYEFKSSKCDLVEKRPWKNGLTIEITEEEGSDFSRTLLKTRSFLFAPSYSREELSSELILFIHYERAKCSGTPPTRFG